jgi:hypothetical protein
MANEKRRKKKKVDDNGEELKGSKTRRRKEYYATLIIDYYTRGYDFAAIRRKVADETAHNVGFAFINTTISNAIREWQATQATMMTDHKAIELERVNRLEQEAWEGWLRSQQPQITQTEKWKLKDGSGQAVNTPATGQEDNFEMVEKSRTGKRTAGEVRFLDLVKWCIEYRCKILGFELPKPTNMTPQTVENITHIRQVVFEINKRG